MSGVKRMLEDKVAKALEGFVVRTNNEEVQVLYDMIVDEFGFEDNERPLDVEKELCSCFGYKTPVVSYITTTRANRIGSISHKMVVFLVREDCGEQDGSDCEPLTRYYPIDDYYRVATCMLVDLDSKGVPHTEVSDVVFEPYQPLSDDVGYKVRR